MAKEKMVAVYKWKIVCLHSMDDFTTDCFYSKDASYIREGWDYSNIVSITPVKGTKRLVPVTELNSGGGCSYLWE